jgi:hypothetical protein
MASLDNKGPARRLTAPSTRQPQARYVDNIYASKEPRCDADLTNLAEQFPDLANFFPVLRKGFPVNLLREFREKSLQRSGFWP